MAYTPNINLEKQSGTDRPDLDILNRNLDILDTEMGKRGTTVNGKEADADGNYQVDEVAFAQNFVADDAQQMSGEFLFRTTGGDASLSDGDATLVSILGRRTHTGVVEENLTLTVDTATREEGEEPITATIDRDTFVAYVSNSGTTTLTYTDAWSANPTLYGVTVTGTPVSGDQIQIVYVKEDRGTITVATPSAFRSTGWNLYNNTLGYARVKKYSDSYGFLIGGTYTAVKFATTVSGTQSTITPVNGYFTIPSDGYVFVTGGNATDTYILMTWSDWTAGYEGSFKAYSEDTISLSAIMSNYFPYGLCQVGGIADEINLSAGYAISRITRLAYSAENLATAKNSGRAYEADTNYIYLVKETPEATVISVSGSYDAYDHGLEIIDGSSVAVFVQTLYGQNLKDKLRTDVLTKSAQTLSSAQQAQARTNIGAASAVDLSTLSNNLTTKVGIGTGNKSGIVGTDENSNAFYVNSKLSNDEVRQLQSKDSEITFQRMTSGGAWSRYWTLFPMEMGNTVSSDLNTVVNGRLQIYQYNSNTLHSPYKEHSDWGAEGLILSYLSNANFGVQLGLISGGPSLTIRTMINGSWSVWRTIESTVPN